MKAIRILSLFSGAGGLDVGFHKAGFETVACVEINPIFCKTLARNKPKYFPPDCRVIEADVRDLSPDQLGAIQCDFVIGGPPCQSFSAAGRRAGGVTGVNDRRGSLFEHYCRLIEHLKPRGFLFENVRGILSANKREDWQLILSTFSSLGYAVVHRVLDAADYGAPQHRERLILVGSRDLSSRFLFPRPLRGPDSRGLQPYVSCGEAIADLQDRSEPVHQYVGKYGRLLSEIPPGENYRFFTKEMGYPNPIFAWRSRFSDFLHKAHPDYPVKTIVARLGAYSGPFHWKNRRFTVAEFKRLFTFPDDYEISGGLGAVLQQIGNSVIPVFAEHLARAVRKQFFCGRGDVELLPAGAELSFDRRKGTKARKTRSVRVNLEPRQASLFETASRPRPEPRRRPTRTKVYFCTYPDWKTLIRTVQPPKGVAGEMLAVSEKWNGQAARLDVCECRPEGLSKRKMLEYRLRFREPIGDGLSTISCSLNASNVESIVAAWDAIEHCLNEHSSYLSLMDVFGHFTEPHPIFALELDVFAKKDSFLLRFAKHFSDFSRVAVDYPSSALASLQGTSDRRDFLPLVKWLRSLRFDVRVYETNPTIRPGFFRCCYPFTLHIDKQVSVSWTEASQVCDATTLRGEMHG